MYHFVKSHIQDDYAMSVLYYELREELSFNQFNLAGLSTLEISQKYLEDGNITISHTYINVKYSLALLLSVRALMLDKSLIRYCHDYFLLYQPAKQYDLSDILRYSSFLLEFPKDNEFFALFNLLIKVCNGGAVTQQDIDDFNSHTQKPEERNLQNYFRRKSQSGKISDEVIGDCAFLMDNTITDYTVSNNIKYIGDTAFAFCASLQTLRIEGDNVLFGRFPIIECDKLTHIYVPAGTTEFYKQSLPYYSNIISVEEGRGRADSSEIIDVGNGLEHIENDSQISGSVENQGSKKAEDGNYEDDDAELAVVSMQNTDNIVNESNDDYKRNQLVKGSVITKNEKNYIVRLESGKDINIPLKKWITRLSIVGKKMVLRKVGFDYINHRTLWTVMTVI